ncbi:MAG: EFR1 family ferrodoxin [Thermodesulfobacteriota bacterium]
MKTCILCFSQSGNTRKVADEIKAGIEKSSGSCDLLDLTATGPEAVAAYDLVGLGCPVFYYKEPFNVTDAIAALPSCKGKAAFVFITHGATPGMALERLWRQMAGKGFAVVGGLHTYADASLPFYPHPTLTTGHPDEADLREAREFGEKTAELARRVLAGEKGLLPEPPASLPGWWQEEAAMLSQEFLGKVLPRLSIDPERCIACGTCADACPVSGVDPLAEPPRLQDPCVFCFNCVKACPEAAIVADWSGLVAMAPQSYARYRKALEEAEARGEFRWLMDPDSLNLDDPLYLQKQRELKGK